MSADPNWAALSSATWSTITLTGVIAARQTSPPAEVRTLTKFALISPATKLMFDVDGSGWSHGHALTQPGPAPSVTVRLNDTMLRPAAAWKLRGAPGRTGPPSMRESMTRTGLWAVIAGLDPAPTLSTMMSVGAYEWMHTCPAALVLASTKFGTAGSPAT